MQILEKWEYKIMHRKEFFPDIKVSDAFRGEKIIRKFEEHLNLQGEDGWEWLPMESQGDAGWMVFRRRIFKEF